MQCNICGGITFLPQKSRADVRCKDCGSVERTRVLKLLLDSHNVPRAGQRMLHFAPEPGLSAIFQDVLGDGYDPVDFNPKRYARFCKARRFDLTTDAEALPSRTYDLILHMHVMEHIRCDVTAVLFHLHRALKEDGLHIFSIPVLPGRTYASDLGEIPEERAVKEFGQFDHVRRYGSIDIQKTLGMVFELPQEYNLEKDFAAEELDRYNIPAYARTGYTPHNVLVMKKDMIRLKADAGTGGFGQDGSE